MGRISYAILKKHCNETTESAFWDILRKDFGNNDTKIEFVMKEVYDKRFIRIDERI